MLDWFEARLGPSGLLGRLEWWNFVDWVEGHGFEDGEPPYDDGGQSAILSLQYVLALREAADLEQAAGNAETAGRYRARADRVANAVKAATWDVSRQLFADTPSKKTYSQHVNVLAILADLVPPADAPALMRKVLDDRSLTQATYYFQFYVFRAMRKAGLGDEYLEPARALARHAGARAHHVGGDAGADAIRLARVERAPELRPADDRRGRHAGDARLRDGTDRTALGALATLSADVATPRGLVQVRYSRSGNGLTADVTLPAGVTGTFSWKGTDTPLRPGASSCRWSSRRSRATHVGQGFSPVRAVWDRASALYVQCGTGLQPCTRGPWGRASALHESDRSRQRVSASGAPESTRGGARCASISNRARPGSWSRIAQ